MGSIDGRGPRPGHCTGLPHHIEPSEDQRADARQRRRGFVPARVLFGSSWQLDQRASCLCEPRAGCRLRPLIGCCAALLLWSVVVGLCHVGMYRGRPRSGGRSGPSSSPKASSGSVAVDSARRFHVGEDLGAVVARSQVLAVDTTRIADQGQIVAATRNVAVDIRSARCCRRSRCAALCMSLTVSSSVSTSGVRWSSLLLARYPLL